MKSIRKSYNRRYYYRIFFIRLRYYFNITRIRLAKHIKFFKVWCIKQLLHLCFIIDSETMEKGFNLKWSRDKNSTVYNWDEDDYAH
jgi:hypothetical protein